MKLLVDHTNLFDAALIIDGQPYAGNLSPENLQAEQPSKAWRPDPVGGAPVESFIDIDYGASLTHRVVALVAGEWFSVNAEWRVVEDTTQGGLGSGGSFDTGWLQPFGGLSPTIRKKVHSIHYGPADRTFRWQRLSVRDTGADPTDLLTIGRFWCGNPWVLAVNTFGGELPTRIAPKESIRLSGGADFNIEMFGKMHALYPMLLDKLERRNLDQLHSTAATHKQILTHLNTDAAAPESSDWLICGTLDEIDAHGTLPDEQCDASISITEMI